MCMVPGALSFQCFSGLAQLLLRFSASKTSYSQIAIIFACAASDSQILQSDSLIIIFSDSRCPCVAQELDARQVQIASVAGQLTDVHPTLRAKNNNASRVLKSLAAKKRLFQPVYANINCRTAKHDATPVIEQVAFVPPAAMAKALLLQDRRALFGESGALEFWRDFQKAHPAHELFTDIDADLEYIFPYALHGDDGSGLCQVPTLVVSWQPVLSFKAKQAAWLKRYLIAIVSSRKMAWAFVSCEI